MPEGRVSGRFMVLMHAQKRKEAFMNQVGRDSRRPNSYPLEIRARRSLAPPFMVPMRYLNKISRAAFNNAFISSSLPMVMRRKSFVSG